jgi:hypothetical protein
LSIVVKLFLVAGVFVKQVGSLERWEAFK